MADYQAYLKHFTQENVGLLALSVDPWEKAKEMVEQLHLDFPVAYGLEVPRDAEKIGAFWEERRGIFHATDFILNAERKHGVPRFTGDLALFGKPDTANAQSILAALKAFGFTSVGLTLNDLECPDQVVQLGVPPVRIDPITSIIGVSWDEAWADRIAGRYGDIPVHYIGRDQFIANKRATGRTQDVADLEMLGEA